MTVIAIAEIVSVENFECSKCGKLHYKPKQMCCGEEVISRPRNVVRAEELEALDAALSAST